MPITDDILGTGQLPTTGETWRLRIGTAADLDATYDLQNHVNDSLPAQDQYFIVPKTKVQLADDLQRHDEALVYVLDINGQHAAQMVVRPHLTAYEIERHTQAFAACGQNLSLPHLLVQGALVDPQWRGRQLLRRMLEHLTTLTPAPTALMARIVPPNVASWISFIESGYRIAAAARDPDDERRVFYLYRDGAVRTATETILAAPDFTTCQDLLQSGWQGTGYDRASRQIIFSR